LSVFCSRVLFGHLFAPASFVFFNLVTLPPLRRCRLVSLFCPFPIESSFYLFHKDSNSYGLAIATIPLHFCNLPCISTFPQPCLPHLFRDSTPLVHFPTLQQPPFNTLRPPPLTDSAPPPRFPRGLRPLRLTPPPLSKISPSMFPFFDSPATFLLW